MRELTYREVGASMAWPLPTGYDHLHMRERLGGPAAFDAARTALFSWAPHRAAGITIAPADAPVTLDATVRLGLRIGPLRLGASCRVVRLLDDPDCAGFAYGTLPGHPECGEEAFLLDRTAAGTWFTISAFSRPAAWYARLGAPVTRLVQRRILSVYMDALKA